jgi:Putative prokaryotic signal transducing protein
MNPNLVWQSKSDEEVVAAANALSDYTEEGEQIIRDELRRRRLPEPPPGIGRCPGCGRTLHANDPADECAQCGEPYPPEILAKMATPASSAGDQAASGDSDDDLVVVATFPALIDASLARSALDAAGIPSVVPNERPGGRSSERPWVELLVRPRDRDEAVAILKDAGHQ